MLALRAVIDIPEDDLAILLRIAAGASRMKEKQTATKKSAMDVDDETGSAIPALSAVLPLCVTYPSSTAALRLAFRQRLNDAGALMAVLQLLLEWLHAHSQEERQLFPEETKKDLHGALIPIFLEKQRKQNTLPSLEKVRSSRYVITRFLR